MRGVDRTPHLPSLPQIVLFFAIICLQLAILTLPHVSHAIVPPNSFHQKNKKKLSRQTELSRTKTKENTWPSTEQITVPRPSPIFHSSSASTTPPQMPLPSIFRGVTLDPTPSGFGKPTMPGLLETMPRCHLALSAIWSWLTPTARWLGKLALPTRAWKA